MRGLLLKGEEGRRGEREGRRKEKGARGKWPEGRGEGGKKMGEGEERDRGTERKGKENRDHPPTIFGLKVALVAVYIVKF